MRAQFREKTYESYFLAELARRTNILYAPDQLDEAFLGFDGAFFLPFAELRHWLPYMRRRRWELLTALPVSAIDHFADELNDRLPPFRFNLFVQYKRPDYMMRASAAEWPSWSRPYYRYDTMPHQQELLEKVALSAGRRAATVYAAPAFWTAENLFDCAKTNSIVASSNIVSVALLNGHDRFSFSSSGNFGIAHSKPVNIESPAFDRILAEGLESEGLPFTKHVKMLSEQVRSVFSERKPDYELWASARAAILGSPEILPSRSAFLDALITLEAFSQAFGVNIYPMG